MRINRITIYIGILISLLFYVAYTISRLLPFDLNHVVYVCQSILQSLPDIVIYASSFVFGLVVLKLLIDFIFMTKYANGFRYTSHPKYIGELAKKYKLENKIVMYKSAQPAAFCLGIVRPKIYISSDMIKLLNENEMEAVILHEMYHLNYKNNLMLFIFNIFSYILFFFPFIKDLKRQYEIHEEIQADKLAYTYLKAKAPLVTSLKKLLLYEEPATKYGFGFSKTEGVEYRIRSITENHIPINTFSLRNSLISLASFVVLSSLLLLPITRTHVHAQGRDIMVMCYDSNNCQQMCKNTTSEPSLLNTSTNRSSLLKPYSPK